MDQRNVVVGSDHRCGQRVALVGLTNAIDAQLTSLSRELLVEELDQRLHDRGGKGSAPLKVEEELAASGARVEPLHLRGFLLLRSGLRQQLGHRYRVSESVGLELYVLLVDDA